jgi:UDP-galactopyranose mutase
MTKRHYEWLIVGAGFTGAVLAEQIASQLDKNVLVIDRRGHVAGNAFDTHNEHDVLFHQYGPHIFHTNSAAIFEYLSNFTDWMPYEHRVVAMINNRLVPVPFNLTSLSICFPLTEADRLAKLLIDTYGMEVKVPILKMRESEDGGIRDLAEYIYKNVFFGYTTKQWGLTPEQLSPMVTGRVPVNISYDDRYFQDTYQYMPRSGYSALFSKLLSHDRITVGTSEDFFSLGSDITYENVVFTGPIDEFFHYEFGALPYRSLAFEFQTVRQGRHQPVGTVNYPNEMAFTRITEQRYLTGQQLPHTTLTLEFPRAHEPGVTEPYYPIPTDENQILYRRYLTNAAKQAANVTFAGRLGDYQYYNMDQAVGHALSIFRKRVLPHYGRAPAVESQA